METAAGLVRINDRFGVEEQQVTPVNFVGTVVAAGSDLSTQVGAIIRPARPNGIFIVDNAWVELTNDDASGSLQVLSVSLMIQAGLAVPNQGLYWAHGIKVQVPDNPNFAKTAVAETKAYGFEFVPLKESLLLTRAGANGGRDNLLFVANIAIRNNDGVNPHNFSGNVQIWHRSGYSIG